jgi:biopolymer transport protein ExbB
MSSSILLALDFKAVAKFFNEGGIFMYALALTSFVALAAIVFKLLSLSRKTVLPADLEAEVTRCELTGNLAGLSAACGNGGSTLARLCQVALRHRGRSRSEITEAVQASARDETVQLNAGMIILDTIITVAPLLGLLGTASGLAVIFSGLGDTPDQALLAQGIDRALHNTIVGLAIAVPAVVAHGWFSRRIEVMVSRLEVLLSGVAKLCEDRDDPPGHAAAAVPGKPKAQESAAPVLPRVPERP